MRVHDFTGLCVMSVRWGLAVLLPLVLSSGACADEFPADAVELDAESGQRVEEPGTGRDWRLDPAVFTEISPVTAAEIAIRLPEDQREED